MGEFQMVNFLSIYQLQYLVDKVAEAIGEKHKYEAVINPHLRYGARAFTNAWVRQRTNRRKIEFSYNEIQGWFEEESDKNMQPEGVAASYHKHRRTTLVKTIVHEIAHFKTEQLYRTRVKQGRLIPQHRHHTKRFYMIEKKLLQIIEPKMATLISIDLSQVTPPPPKPKPTKEEKIKAKLAQVEKHIRLLETRLKRTNTLLKKWKRKQVYYKKKLLSFSDG
jgi:hypothetical protein